MGLQALRAPRLTAGPACNRIRVCSSRSVVRPGSVRSEYAGDRAAAGRAFSIAHPVFFDRETAPADQDLPALRAEGGFRFPPDIADIDELQSGFLRQSRGLPQGLDRRRRRLGVLVVRMEAADVPRDP